MKITCDTIDQYADWIPFVSIVTNALNLYAIICVIPKLSSKQILANRHYTRLKLEGAGRCVTAMLPFGRPVAIRLYDFFKGQSNDRNYIESQIAQHGMQALEKASPHLRNDRKFINALIDKYDVDSILPFVGDLLRNDPHFIWKIFQNCDESDQIHVIENAGPEVRNNHNFMQALIQRSPQEAFNVLGDDLLGNEEWMTKHVFFLRDERGGKAVKLEDVLAKVPNSLKNSSKFLKELVPDRTEINYIPMMQTILNAAGEVPRNDAEFMKLFRFEYYEFEQPQIFLDKIGDELSNDPDFMRKLYHDASGAEDEQVKPLDKVGSKLKDNVEFMTDMSYYELQWVLDNMGENLSNDKEFIEKLIRNALYEEYFEAILSKIGINLKNNKDFFKGFMHRSEIPVQFIGDSLKNDPSFIQELVTKYPIEKVLPVIGSILRNDKIYLQDLVKVHPKFFRAIINSTGETLRNNPDFILWCLDHIKNTNKVNIFQTAIDPVAISETPDLEDPSECYETVLSIVGNDLRDDESFFTKVRNFFVTLKLPNGLPECLYNMIGVKLRKDQGFMQFLFIGIPYQQGRYLLAILDNETKKEWYGWLSNKYTSETLNEFGIVPA